MSSVTVVMVATDESVLVLTVAADSTDTELEPNTLSLGTGDDCCDWDCCCCLDRLSMRWAPVDLKWSRRRALDALAMRSLPGDAVP